jgi:hypothetical protein
MAAPLHLRSVPRISRILAFVLFCVCLIFLLPKFDLGHTGSHYSFSFGSSKPQYDILRFVDPLIGTTNGGECLVPLQYQHISHDISHRPCLSRRNPAIR